MNLNPYEPSVSPDETPAGLRQLSGVSPLEWLAVILVGAFAIAATIACWIWLRDFP